MLRGREVSKETRVQQTGKRRRNTLSKLAWAIDEASYETWSAVAKTPAFMSRPVAAGLTEDEVGTALSDHEGRRVGVGRAHGGQDRSVYHAQARDAMHLELVVDDRHRIAAHAAGADRMVGSGAQLRDVVEQGFIRLRLRARPHLADDQFFQGGLVGNPANQPQ